MKLGNLMKKELKELLTKQAIFGMLFTCALFIFMGEVMGGAIDNAISNSEISIVNRDNSAFTEKMLEGLTDYGVTPKLISIENDNYYDELKEQDIKNIVIIPENFGTEVEGGSTAVNIECVSLIDSTGFSSSMSSLSSADMTKAISNYVSDYIQSTKYGLSDEQQELINKPIVTVDYTAANGKTVEVSSEMLTAIMLGQSMIAPFAIFFLLLMASQMIMTAISTEKIDKTLETLMSAPVSRITVLTAKMLAALVVALLNAGTMVIGFAFYMQSMMGSAVEEATANASELGAGLSVAEAMQQLGLSLSAGDIVIFGIQLFLTIAIGLSISLILGAMATDAKSVQTLVMPVMLVTLIPFFVTMFIDINTLSPIAKAVLYIIPFTHTYTAMTNMMFDNTALVIGGLAYQVFFFIVCMYLAVKVFTTDLLFTMNLSFKTKSKSKA